MTSREARDKVNILLVDDQPSKLLTYEVILRELGRKSDQGRIPARKHWSMLLKNDIAVVLMDVCMPDLDGFELASMIREHPRFQKIAMIFISAIHLAEIDHLRGYEMGAVDYVPVPVVPEVLRAKVRVFADLYRKNRQLERLNAELEQRVQRAHRRTGSLDRATAQSEQRRSLALAAGNMGSWDWDLLTGEFVWDEGQHRIYGVEPGQFAVTPENFKALILPDDWERLQSRNGSVCCGRASRTRPSIASGAPTARCAGVPARRPPAREQRQGRAHQRCHDGHHRAQGCRRAPGSACTRGRSSRQERDGDCAVHRSADEGATASRNMLPLSKAASRRSHALTRCSRIRVGKGPSLQSSSMRSLLPSASTDVDRIRAWGPKVLLNPTTAQTLALALHELATNAVKYGALSQASGNLELKWDIEPDTIALNWCERGGPAVREPQSTGFGTRIITGSIERQLGGKATFDWHPEGLSCVLRVPHQQPTTARSDTVINLPDGAASRGLPGQRIMIVEDEALVAMILEDQLEELGISIVATCASVPEAMRAIDKSAPEAAILDVNLGGQLVYPVADRLIDRGIPFVFVTGYGRESVDQRYSFVKVLEKPVERQALEGLFSISRHPGAIVSA